MNDTPAKKAKKWNFDYLITPFQIISTILVVICSTTFSEEGGKLLTEDPSIQLKIRILSLIGLILSIVLLIIVSILTSKQAKKTKEIEAELKNEQTKALDLENKLAESTERTGSLQTSIAEDFNQIVTALCITISKSLDFGSKDGVHERISFYVFDRKAGFFILIGRFSENTEYNSFGHPNYQKNKGNIGRVWENGFSFQNDYPKFNSKNNKNQYVKRTMRDGFTRDEVLEMRMKSRLYCGTRISDSKNNPLAVVIVESTCNLRWTLSQIRDYFDQESIRLNRLFEIIHPKTPSIWFARTKGF
jgi:hypothetical protein